MFDFVSLIGRCHTAGKMEEGHPINIRRAHLCLYNGKAFVGNVQTVDHTIQDPMKPWNWTFKPAVSLSNPCQKFAPIRSHLFRKQQRTGR
jgi:hypothetical protein